MDSIYLYGALEAAMNFDLENDPDMVAIEANLDTIDYALESARLEYDMSGDDRYVPVIEAAEEKQKSGIKDWFSTMAKKISLFVKNAIQSVRMMLSRVANAVRLKKANKMKKKMGNVSSVSANIADAKIPASVIDALKKGISGDIDTRIKNLIDSFTVKLQKDGSISKDFKQTMKDGMYKVASEGEASKDVVVEEIKPILDNAVNYLGKLGKSFPKAKAIINEKNAQGVDKGIIRVATTTTYSIMTSVVKEYYSGAMKVANAVCKFDKKASKDSKKAEKQNAAPKAEEKKA